MGTYHRYGGYDDGSGSRWRRRRPNGWPLDTKCPDGFTCNGFRKVDQKGRIRFGGSYWTDEAYKPGMVVFVSLEDPLGAQISTVAIDPRWTPDNISEDVSGFYGHVYRVEGKVLPEAVGDWNVRRSK